MGIFVGMQTSCVSRGLPLLLLLITLQTFVSSYNSVYHELNEEMDQMIENLYGDIEPSDELFGNFYQHPRHVGTDNVIHYTNEWLVHVPGGNKDADRVARETGNYNAGEVKGFDKVYLMKKLNHPRIHKRSAPHLSKKISSVKGVQWVEQLYAKRRVKRRNVNNVDIISLRDSNSFFSKFFSSEEDNSIGRINYKKRFNDPLWNKQWHMQDTRTTTKLPRLDLNVLPVFDMGITGKGINVNILDDGLEGNHTDLRDNYNPMISGDLNDDDEDPTPKYGTLTPNAHGTRCAGEIAMKANNSKCGVGIAYNAGIGGVRMLDGPVTDRTEAEALSFALEAVDVISASWGPNDDGQTVEGPGRLAQKAFFKGVKYGRKGKGIIYVWASGNGGSKGDSCSCDGYTSSIFTLSVGSASESGSFPWYGEKCPSTMAVTYSSGAYTDQKIATTDIKDGCTTSHTGTSASAPLAAGIVALTLEANGDLSWRDVQHIVVWTAQPGALLENPGWKINGAGFRYNSRFGFGLMDAHAMVRTALNWTNVPSQKVCSIRSRPLQDPTLLAGKNTQVSFLTDACKGTKHEVNYLEHVQLVTSLHYTNRGKLQIDLQSPQGTVTRMLFPRKDDISPTGFEHWPFMSVHTWGENPHGEWKVTIHDESGEDNEGFLNSMRLVFFGTKDPPAQVKWMPRVYDEPLETNKVETSNDILPSFRLHSIIKDLMQIF